MHITNIFMLSSKLPSYIKTYCMSSNMFLYLINYHIQNIMQSRLFTLHSDTFSSSPSRFTSSSTSFCDLVRSHGPCTNALKTKSKFRARIRQIRSLSPSKIATRFRRVRLTGQMHKIHLPKPSTAHQEYLMLKNFQ